MIRNLELGFLSRKRASRMSFAILNAIQDEPLEYMVASIGLVLKTIADVKHLSPQDIMTAADNMLKTTGLSDDQYVEALRQFVKEEVPNA